MEKTDSLAVRNQTILAMQGLADWLSKVEPDEFGAALNLIKSLTGALENAEGLVKNRAVEMVRTKGNRETEKGTYSLQLGAYTVRAIPTRTGVDSKKLEAHLRGRGIEVTKAMDATLTYKVNEGKLATCLAEGVLSQSEVDGCKADTSYRVEVK